MAKPDPPFTPVVCPPSHAPTLEPRNRLFRVCIGKAPDLGLEEVVTHPGQDGQKRAVGDRSDALDGLMVVVHEFQMREQR
jgi:hypothetical protein